MVDRDTYDQVADKVGFVPNLRKRDNLMQAIVVGVAGPVGAGIGALLTEKHLMGALVGLGGGLLAGLLLSGTYLCIVGLLRK